MIEIIIDQPLMIIPIYGYGNQTSTSLNSRFDEQDQSVELENVSSQSDIDDVAYNLSSSTSEFDQFDQYSDYYGNQFL
jgi:hypothetical protein